MRHAGSAISGRASYFAVFHGVRNGVWTWVKNMPGRLLAVTWPVWAFGALLLLARGLVKRQFKPTWDGFVAAFADLGPSLANRRKLKVQRKAKVAEIARALTWNPFAYLGRRIEVRPFFPLSKTEGREVPT